MTELTKEQVMEYLKANPLHEIELINMLAAYHVDLKETTLDTKQEAEIFSDIAKVEGIHDLIRSAMNQDIQRYFNATTPLEQAMSKGAYSRMQYWKSRLVAKPKDPKAKPARLPGKRYGK